ncbi:A24 family peptidase [Streptomyces sp. VRA16 Mangrove soil]|uniref:prepilin peptidase n=1 Tax=Streptomyces sp. VRA16 Mangrove soil TaxID=2817434 RepID=UPI001A9F7C6F|nr:A24 family peptidase [Streptomyces sp. VRA16 Mangrove soil]MBO1334895.1 prepilin peptidase [Streptomyces sp. VRA16 Mangrove soil]
MPLIGSPATLSTGALIAVATLWGAVTGALLPRPAYRLSVEPDEPWRPGPGWAGVRPGPPAPLLAAVTALVCALLAAATGTRPELGAWLLLAPLGVLLATVDFAVHRLPDVLTLPFAVLCAGALGVAALLPEPGGSWRSAGLGALGMGAFYLVLHLANSRAMGFGDVKLALGLGAALGWYGLGVLFIGVFAGVLLNGLFALVLVVARRAGRKTEIPFGPFMLLGAYAGVLLGALAA